MITRSKQNWEIGQQVNVGFMKDLVVVAKVPTPGDSAPDAYVLVRGTTFYSFVPHNGVSKVTQAEAEALIIEGQRQVQKAELAKVAHADKEREMAEFLAKLKIA